ncbi:alpha-galactosidase [Pseudonocardia humida]|uniref:Alpha-galactosidase n=1 Tax=Pseudonocardia humida TaxID=2800819 RepID=A0ABT1A1C9_9PSEU|nr:alpha-galactosidase [Pseudonocardia humida]MCO1656733.1 alpha-galactosidase [Pseudonocardia humida]
MPLPSPTSPQPGPSDPLHLRAGGVSLVLDLPVVGPPVVLHWGTDLGPLDPAALRDLATGLTPMAGHNAPDVAERVGMLPEAATGWVGAPGLLGHRDGDAWSPRFRRTGHRVTPSGGGERLRVRHTDPAAGLDLDVEVELFASGLLRCRAEVRNTGAGPYALERLDLALPVPPVAAEVLDQAGRWSRERAPQRRPLTVGVHLRENRRGRTGPDAATVLFAGEAGFRFGAGEVWGLHVGWSGNHRSAVERTATGDTLLSGGELLLPGEVVLGPGEGYVGPWLYATHGDGLDEAAARVHEYLRARPGHPRSPRPVVLNTWEAVYFDHDLDRLLRLAEVAAELGVERYVLDDGWFMGRRDDTAGLGDWYVDPTVWPDGLHPLVDRVRALGMQFGLWVEPEMVNPDSRLAREHPDWILQTGGRLPVPSRHQQVLDVARPEVHTYLLERLSALVAEYDLAYLKWDHNRDLVDAGSTATHRAGVHAQTLAVYRLLDELRAAHPGLEIESCSSGGARADLGVLQRTDRIWASDCIDPHERQRILRWTGQLLPPELVGSHVGSPVSHSTGRAHDLSFRGATALFGSFGIEWDVTGCSAAELAELAGWVALAKRFRPLLHGGRTVRVDHPDPALWAHGVVAPDRSAALFAFVMMERPLTWPPGPVRLPGLDPDAAYRLVPVGPGAGSEPISGQSRPSWQAGGLVHSGRVLGAVGVPPPALHPDHAALVHLVRE